MYFPVGHSFRKARQKRLKAVDDVSFSIRKGETMGLVGESGCGKTTIGRTILKLYAPTAGSIRFEGRDITLLNDEEMLPYRSKMQMIFQDPFTSLDPRETVGQIIGTPLALHGHTDKKAREDEIRSLLQMVGLKSDHINRYPHEFSGGQRQRIGIARALALKPDFIVCDEPISALDVSIQAQVINILEELQHRLGITYLFISHDLAMVRHISHNVGVMYLGHLVEYAPVEELYSHPLHPYTTSLLSAEPIADPKSARTTRRIILQGDLPSPLSPPSGCPFRTRCPNATSYCASKPPLLRDLGNNHLAACHNV